jgi:hypothetical protein
VVNQGAINAPGGPVYLIAPNVENHGIITAPGGDIILAAGKTVQLVDPQSPDVRIEMTAPGKPGGQPRQADRRPRAHRHLRGMIRHGGTIRANSASLNEKGEVVLVAKKTSSSKKAA